MVKWFLLIVLAATLGAVLTFLTFPTKKYVEITPATTGYVCWGFPFCSSEYHFGIDKRLVGLPVEPVGTLVLHGLLANYFFYFFIFLCIEIVYIKIKKLTYKKPLT